MDLEAWDKSLDEIVSDRRYRGRLDFLLMASIFPGADQIDRKCHAQHRCDGFTFSAVTITRSPLPTC